MSNSKNIFTSGGTVGLDTMSDVVAEAGRLQNKRLEEFSHDEIAQVAAEMNIDESFLRQAYENILFKKKLIFAGKIAIAVIAGCLAFYGAYSWASAPSVTEGDQAILKAGLEEIQNR